MNGLLDKLIIFILCTAFYLQNSRGSYVVVPVIVAITVSAFNTYIDRDYFHMFSFMVYAAVCLFSPRFLFLMPLLCYDLLCSQRQWWLLLAVVPLGVNLAGIPSLNSILTLLFIALAWLIKRRTISLEEIRREYILLRDTTKEFSLRLESKNKELMEKQDYEISLATLNERNRIARDIHDSVGHLLSSSILQIGALMATCREESVQESLNTLKDTLSQGMDSIRNSIHDLHDQSIDLEAETRKLVQGFCFCPISLDYEITGNPGQKIKYSFLAILKEALSNIIKHSNATLAGVTLREHPAFYQLIVKDNGSARTTDTGDGIGLKNIKDRVGTLNGIVNIDQTKGFVLFISVPKE